MGPLAAVERFLERLFERQSARLFKTAVRPVQVQRRLERAMEAARTRDGSRTLVPHRFTIRLTPDDLAALGVAAPSLAADLADGALAFARAHGYSLLDRPTVALRADGSVATGDIMVDAVDPRRLAPPMSSPAAAAPADDVSDAPDRDSDAGPRIRGGTADDEPDPATLDDVVPDRTAVFVIPGVEGPRATFRELRADGTSRTFAFDGRPLTIGRAPDNALVIRDSRASRHHARIDGRRGSLVLSDLGSTNGSFVNDRPVDSVALGVGDRIRIGTTAFVVEALGDDSPSDERSVGRAGSADP